MGMLAIHSQSKGFHLQEHGSAGCRASSMSFSWTPVIAFFPVVECVTVPPNVAGKEGNIWRGSSPGFGFEKEWMSLLFEVHCFFPLSSSLQGEEKRRIEEMRKERARVAAEAERQEKEERAERISRLHKLGALVFLLAPIPHPEGLIDSTLNASPLCSHSVQGAGIADEAATNAARKIRSTGKCRSVESSVLGKG